jgi:hypothetical protein
MTEDESSLNKFVANFDTPEKIQANTEAVLALVQQFNAGAPIPPVSASDLKQLWEVTKRMNADMPPRPNVAIGAGVFAAYGIDFVHEAERFMSAQTRLELLSNLLARGVLSEFTRGEELDDKLFDAAATIPICKTDLAEAMLPRLLAESPADVAAKAAEEMRAGGYDPASPSIDGKFIDWLSTKC